MPNINLPNINISENDLKSEETMKQLVDTLFKYKKELNYLLSNLDADNMPAVIKRVSNTEESLDGLSTRVSAAELSITPEAITTTVESNTTELAKKSDIPDPVDTSLLATKSEVAQTATSVRLEFTTLKDENGVDKTIESGVTRINKNGIRVTHSGTNQYSEMRADGFIRKHQYGEANYLNDIYAVTNLATDVDRNYQPPTITITLPSRFRGRGNEVEIIPSLRSFYTGNIGGAYSDGTVVQILRSMRIILEIVGTNFALVNPEIYIDAYVQLRLEDEDTNWYKYRDLKYDLLVIGK